MFSKVIIGKWDVTILWWPEGSEQPHNQWTIYKGTSYDREIQVEPARITDPRPHPMTAESGSTYSLRLREAVKLARDLDIAIRTLDAFQRINVIEKSDMICAPLVFEHGDRIDIYVPGESGS